ncbi:MAG TPA: toll/interleukin-1 receptor domain-containing protein [Acidobacteriaceae bacterium]|nr:toll/interleukin-1 receptor domain-containing protein [Acidobacteriaceae bacterium]
MRKRSFDVFVSHASEDKAAFVEPLATELRKWGLNVWFDRFELRVGDSLRESIERGLATSRYGIVVYSPAFLKKKWPRKELNGLFSREISGNRKRILPILHNLSIAELRKSYPIQADRYSLSSKVPLDELCRELIRVIKPELLELQELERRSFDSAEVFLKTAGTKYPNYEFSVYVANSSGKRIEIRSKVPVTSEDAPTINLRFLGEGVRKAMELLRTGKAQSWSSSEFTHLSSDIPFFPGPQEGMLLSAGPPVDPDPRAVRIEIEDAPETRFELMTMSVVRRGSEEGELRIADDSQPLSISLVNQFAENAEINISLSWRISGFQAGKCQRMLSFVDAALAGGRIKVTDLKGERPTITLPPIEGPAKSGSLDPNTRKLIALCAEIEERLKCTIIMRKNLTEDDIENLEILDSLLNGTESDRDASGTMSLTKGQYQQIDDHICQSTALALRMFLPVANFSGYFEVMGTRIKAPEWGYSAPCDVAVSENERRAFCEAKPGYATKMRVKSVGSGRFAWKA